MDKFFFYHPNKKKEIKRWIGTVKDYLVLLLSQDMVINVGGGSGMLRAGQRC